MAFVAAHIFASPQQLRGRRGVLGHMPNGQVASGIHKAGYSKSVLFKHCLAFYRRTRRNPSGL